MRLQYKFLEETFPIRLSVVHVINCPSFQNKLSSFVKPFVSDDLFEIAHFHTEGIEVLYERIPREMLPEEYCRDYLMDPKQWKAEIVEHKNAGYFSE